MNVSSRRSTMENSKQSRRGGAPVKRSMLLASVMLTACALPGQVPPPEGHISPPAPAAANIPAPVAVSAILPPPKPAVKAPTYSVVVHEVPAKELLFSLARDTKINIDIHPGIEGVVTLNAINEPLPAILDRIARQADIRWEWRGETLSVMPDTPFLRTYKVDYVNLSRDTTATIGVASQIAGTGTGSVGAAGTAAASVAGNNSNTRVETLSKNQFWDTLVNNIRDILRETDKLVLDEQLASGAGLAARQRNGEVAPLGVAAPPPAPGLATASPEEADALPPQASTRRRETAVRDFQRFRYREAASVIANPETGVIAVRATSRQHEKIQNFLDKVAVSSKRQVLIEATIVEIALKEQFRAGVDWQRLSGRTGFTFETLSNASTHLANNLSPFFAVGYLNTASNFSVTIDLLESFGKTRVLSSPKIMALNNQTALLKVVDNRVYFTVKSETVANQSQTITNFTTTANTVPVGLVMSVTPQVDDSDSIILNIRPTVSRITGFVSDPNPALAAVNVSNLVPEIQAREMESVLKVNSGQTVILGGLIQDDSTNNRDGIPGLSRAEGVGFLFGQREENTTKTELVIFLRPTVIANPSLESDELKFYRRYLPQPGAASSPPASRP